MKILIATDNFPPDSWGGAESVAYMQAKGMLSRGHDITVFTTTRDTARVGWSEFEDIKIFKIWSDYHERWRAWLGLYNPQTINKFNKLINTIKPDIIHFHNIHQYLSYACLKKAKSLGAKIFLTAHDVQAFAYGKLSYIASPNDPATKGQFNYQVPFGWNLKYAKKRYNPLRNKIIRKYLSYADKIFAVSHALKEALNQNKINNIGVVHNGIDVNQWDKQINTAEFKRQLDLEGKKIILFVGRLIGSKGRDVLLKAVSNVKCQMSNVVLLAVGSEVDPRYDRVKELTEKLGLKDNVVRHPSVPKEETYKFYKTADVVVVPSLTFDSFPTINLEAGACHKPVIATYLGGSREIIVDGVTGYIVNPYNIDNLAQKIIELLQNKQKAQAMGQAGSERVNQYFTLSQQLDKLLKWYNT